MNNPYLQETMMKLWTKSVVTAFSLLLVASVTQAELSKPDRKKIKQTLKSSGTLYLRMDMPCATGRHPYGTYVRPLVEVSPEGAENEADEGGVRASWWHADSTYWGVNVNDAVIFDEVEIEAEEGTMEIELVTLDEESSTVVRLVDVYTLDDFQAAFDRTFSSRPLQDEHDDWSQEVKQAISERKLMDGMTKRQVFYVTGEPQSFEKKQEGGKKVEVWHLRQNKGVKMGFWTARAGETTGFPETIRFEDGKLAGLGDSSGFSLDD